MMAWSGCDQHEKMMENGWRASIDARGVHGGCSLMDVEVALGYGRDKPQRARASEIDPLVFSRLQDFDGDGIPELLLVTQSAGSGSYGLVHLFRNSKDGLQTFHLPDLDDETKQSYRGHDRFLVHGPLLIREFPGYAEDDRNCCPGLGVQRLIYRFNGDAWTLKIPEKP
jgi:hypothetical protein